jgi:hypothetical protein
VSLQIPFYCQHRGECVSYLESLTEFQNWVLGYQKMVPIGPMDAMRWFTDSK